MSAKILSFAERFEDFHERNPRVFTLLMVLLAEYRRDTGRRQVGFSLLWGAARWKWALEVDPDESGFKLNDHYAPFYARMIMGQGEHLADAFELRASIADAWAAERGYPTAPRESERAA